MAAHKAERVRLALPAAVAAMFDARIRQKSTYCQKMVHSLAGKLMLLNLNTEGQKGEVHCQ
jgi:hypothetical protein